MNHRPALFAAALSLLALSAPRLAAAHDDDHRRTSGVAVALAPPPPYWVAAVLPPPPPSGPWGGPSPNVYYGWLDANRAAFLARWGWNPWRVARYESWYRGYRADLDARWTMPDRHGRKHGPDRGRGHGHADRD
jgi:hypothetical protein